MSSLTLGSLFDGSGGFPLGGLLSGITPVWASEIEPFPIRVTTKRIPFMKHYGDICSLDGSKIEPVDIITFGSPCTNMSVAGKREGLNGSQSVLFYEAIRIIKEMRCATNGTKPRFIVWENVPGAFSSGKGADFHNVLKQIVGIKTEAANVPMPQKRKWLYAGEIVGDGYSVAWRTLDAQYWGVPQRRRRCYLVADFANECAGKILFECESVSRNITQGFGSRQGASGNVESGLGTPVGFEPGAMSRLGGHVWHNFVGALRAHAGDNQTAVAVAIQNHPADSRVKIDESGSVQTLTSRMGTGGGSVPLVMNERQYALTVSENVANTLTSTDYKGTQCVFEQSPTVYGICSDGSNAMRSKNPMSGIYKADTTRTIDGNGGNPSCKQGGMAVVCIDQGGGKSACNVTEEQAPTLTCTHAGEPAVCIQGSMVGRKDKNGPQGSGINNDVSFTLTETDRHSVAYCLDRAAYNQGANAQYDISVQEEQAQTLVAKGPHAVASFYPQMKAESQCFRQDGTANTLVNGTCPGHHNGIIEPEYVVRRLTPTECALLQGFPIDWCTALETINPTDSEIEWWSEVFEAHRKIVGNTEKPKTAKQIAKWLKNPYSDSAEYKLWGNGVALPCVIFVLSAIEWVVRNAE